MKKTFFNTVIAALLFYFLLSCDPVNKKLEDVPSQYLNTNIHNIHYKKYGKGDKTLVFIHGWGCDMNVWSYQFDYFKDNYSLLFIDLPGYGKSTQKNREYTIESFAKSVQAVVELEAANEPVFIAHSMGLAVAVKTLQQGMNENAMLCNIDGVYFDFPSDSTEKAQYIAALSSFADLFSGENYQENVNQFYSGFITENTAENVIHYIRNTMGKTPQDVGYSSMLSLINEKNWDFQPINQKSIALYANIDELADDNESILRKRFKQLSYHEIDNVHHFLMMEKPAVVNETLENWIQN